MIVELATQVPFPVDAVRAWHARPGALERLVPPWARVRDAAFAGGRHLHAIESAPGGTLLRDRIEYTLPGGAVGEALAGPGVRRRLAAWLRYRHDTVRDDLAVHAGAASACFAVSGASGFVGSALVPFLTAGGHRVVRLVRPGSRRAVVPHSGDAVSDVHWDPGAGLLPARELEGVDAVINLCGAGIADGRWSPARKQVLRESRIRSTSLLAATLAMLDRRPAALVSVSATGIYGNRGDDTLPDDAAHGSDFLARLAQDWERAADPARDAGIAVAHPRLGLVLSPAGGALQRLLLPFRLGLGGPLGSGRQWTAPVSIDDVLGMLVWAARTPALDGAFNAVSPGPVRNRDLAAALGRALHRPAIMPVPAPALRLVLGELADTVLLASQRAVPALLTGAGFRWRHPTLDSILQRALGGA